MRIKESVLNTVAFVNGKINQGQERSVKAKKNIIGSFFIKGTSIVISILLVPLAINYVDVSQYGIWLTISSIVAWFSFFDIGLTQGLRNKLAEAIAKREDKLAQIYVSTTYAILGIICGFFWLIFLIVNQFLDWPRILNVPESLNTEVSILALIVFSYFALQFVLRIINTILLANQQPALSSLLSVLGQLLSLICIWILVKTTHGSLIKLGAVFCFAPLLVLLIGSFFFFHRSYAKYRPSFSKVKFTYAKGLFNLGIIFFVIQAAGIVQYQTANFVIARNFSTTDVTAYNIVYKYFGVLEMFFVIFLTPFWSASTEAFMKNDLHWIRKSVKKYNQLNILLIFVGCLMLFFSKDIYDLWLGKGKLDISFYLSAFGFLYFITKFFADTYVAFLNGINALRLQFIACFFSPLVYIGIALLLIKRYHMGPYSLFIASILCNLNGFVLAPLQYHMIVNKNKKGIWIR